MAKKKDKERGIAADLFIQKGMTLTAISEIVNVSVRQLSTWAGADEWEWQRDETLASPAKIRAILLKELKWVSDGNAPTVDTDALSKIAKTMQSLSDKVSPQTVIGVVMMLDNFLAENNPQMATDCLDQHKKFIQQIIQMHG